MPIAQVPGVIPHPLPEVNFLMVEIPIPKPYIFMIRVTRQIKCLIAQAPGGHTLPEVNFLMVEIPTPKAYIFMIRMTRQIKCLIAQALRGHTPPPIWNLFWLTLSYIPLFFQVCCQFVDKYLNVMYKNGHES
jgi:hypothetical protein